MRFKISLSNSSHKAAVTCVGWSSTEEVYSTGDDNQLLSWSISNDTSAKVAQFNNDFFPTDMQFLSRIGASLGKQGDLILITSTDGKFHILNKAGRIERSIEAHKGAILVGQWSNDGGGLLTGGEDGFVKIWSRSGMLRSMVVSSDSSIYGACWSPDSQSIAYTQAKYIVIKQLAPNTKPLKWKAHEGLVLCLAWSSSSELLVSGGEDCKYRVWDSAGKQMFSSVLHDNHIVSLSWSPTGDLFAVGSYNTLRLCDYSGWSRSLEKPNSGCIYKMCWSSDGTQLAAACANGKVLFAHVVDRHVHYKNFTASVTERKTVTVKNVHDPDAIELLELPERVIQMTMRYSHLVLTTPTQCYIYDTSNWNTPAIFDLKDGGSVILISLCEKHMLLVEKNNVGLYNFQGRLIASPRWPNMRLETIKSSHISLSPDTLVVRDAGDAKVIHVIDLGSNRSAGGDAAVNIQHSVNILSLALDQWGPASYRNLLVLDKARDLYVLPVKSNNKVFSKLGRKIESYQWNSEENIIAAIQDTQLIVWYCPQATFSTTLLRLCTFNYDSPELGRGPRINDFVADSVAVRRTDGSLINVHVSPLPAILLRYIQENKWNDALNLCRSMSNSTLWACLAVHATQINNDTIDIAEEAFAHVNHYDKVFFIQHLKTLPLKAQQKAAMAYLGGKFQEAESVLLYNGLVFQAIYNNIQHHNWIRALDLAIKHKTHIDSVLFLRKRYLTSLGKNENNKKFSELQENVKYDDEKVNLKIETEMEKMFNGSS